MRLDTGSANRCLAYAIAFVLMAVVFDLGDWPFASALCFGFAADAIRRAPARSST